MSDEQKKNDTNINDKISKVINETIRPMLQRDGGDFEITEIKDKQVYGQLRGACMGCIAANQTLKLMIEKTQVVPLL